MAKRKTSQSDPSCVKCSPPGGPASTAVATPERPPTSKSKATAVAVPTLPDMSERDMQQILDETLRLAVAAEGIFAKLAAGRDLIESETAVLRRVGPPIVPGDTGRSARRFERWRDSERGRIQTIRRLQNAAGSTADRRGALEAAEKAESTFGKRSEQIAEIIAKLQAERSELQRLATEARVDSDKRRDAVDKLCDKKILPSFVLDRCQRLNRKWSQTGGAKLEQSGTRLSILERLRNLDVSERRLTRGGPTGGEDLEVVRSVIEGLAEFGPDEHSRLAAFGMVHEWVDGFFHGREIRPNDLDRMKWAAYLAGPVADEIARLREEVAQLERLESAHVAALGKLSDCYVPV